MRRGMSENKDPGFENVTEAQAAALIEQSRSETLDNLRGARAWAIATLGAEDDPDIFWGAFIKDESEARDFMIWAACKSIRDLAVIMDITTMQAAEFVTGLIDSGLTDDWG